MGFQFRSLRSSSSGNCLLLWTDTTTLLLDCGIKTYSGCLGVLGEHTKRPDAVLISHAHGDHVCYYSLRVLGEFGTAIHCHHKVISTIQQRHTHDGDLAPRMHCFSDEPFDIGDLTIQPVEVPHAPGYPNFGFVIWCGTGRDRRKLVICTDFNDYGSLVGHLANADFAFIEANHDLELLRKHWNPSSLFHLSNPKTAQLLCEAKQNGSFAPQAVMLGHLSHRRNTDQLAMDAVRDRFCAEGVDMDFPLEIAPRYEASKTICIE